MLHTCSHPTGIPVQLHKKLHSSLVILYKQFYVLNIIHSLLCDCNHFYTPTYAHKLYKIVSYTQT
jgi:hypothetical protein